MTAKLAILIVSAALLAGGGCSMVQSMQLRSDGFYDTMSPKGGGSLFFNPFSWGAGGSSGAGTIPGAGINASYDAPI